MFGPTTRARLLGLTLCIAGLLPFPALATIIIGNPVPVYGEAWSGSTAVGAVVAPVTYAHMYACDGSGGPVVSVGTTLNLTSPDGFYLPAGTWCGVDLDLGGPAAVYLGNNTIDYVYVGSIHLVANPTITGYKFVIKGTTGALAANLDD